LVLLTLKSLFGLIYLEGRINTHCYMTIWTPVPFDRFQVTSDIKRFIIFSYSYYAN